MLSLRRVLAGALALCCVSCAFLGAALAPAAAQSPAGRGADIARLASDLDGVESVRAVKRLQTAYAQYAQAGLWREMANLFADEAEFIDGAGAVHGRKAIEEYFRDAFGQGRDGIPAGSLHTRMIVRPVVNLSADGLAAKGRWSELSMAGSYGGRADWGGGIYQNDYVREGGVWKIARSLFVRMFFGPYEQGWRSDPAAPAIIPYRFTPDEVGQPVPQNYQAPPGPVPAIAAIEQRIERMLDENTVLNLYNAYGHYVDRKMWDDVVDLFDEDGVVELAGIGIYRGKAGIWRAFELAGPAMLRAGELNEHPLFDTIVSIGPGGTEARTRGLQMSQLGDVATGTASIGLAVLDVRFRKEAGTWRIRELRSYPYMDTDYYLGWARSRLPPRQPPPRLAPDQPSPDAAADGVVVIPEIFYPNPATGEMPRYPAGALVPGGAPLASAREGASAKAAPAADRLAEARRKLMMAAAYDGVENLSSAFGTWNDDLQWDKFSALFAREGWRGKAMLGFYIGPDRIRQAEILSRGTTKGPDTVSSLHFRMQPVIDVAADGRSAKLRSRYMHLTTAAKVSGTFAAGIYANDAAVLENGVWKFSNAAIDDSYFESANYRDGWARPRERKPDETGLPPWIARMFEEFPPDVPNAAMPFRQQGAIPGALIHWPAIKPMFFHYANPVSGRLPQWYCPDEHTCDAAMHGAR